MRYLGQYKKDILGIFDFNVFFSSQLYILNMIYVKIATIRESDMTERLMTKSTLENLQNMKADMERKVRDMGKEGSGHQRASVHDDAAAENELNLARGTILNIGELSGVEVIFPRKEVDSIGIGNKVRLQFEDGEETIYLLGKDDVVYRKDLGKS